MTYLGWLSVLASVASLVGVLVVNVRGIRIGDPNVLRRSARRLGWGVAGAFVIAIGVYAIAVVASFGAVAAARPEDKASVLAGGLGEPAAYLRWSIGLLALALLGLVVLRF